MIGNGRLPWVLALGMALVFGGCTAQSGGGGAQDNTAADPLPEFQLGEDQELDADVGAITAADNDALECFGSTVSFTDEDVLLALKTGYVGDTEAAATFEEFVSDMVTMETSKRDQICDTKVGDDPELDASLQRIVDAETRARQCQGTEGVPTLEDALLNMEAAFFEQGRAADDLVAFTDQSASDAEQQADELCAG